MPATPLTVTQLTHTTSVVVDPSAWTAGNATDGNTVANGGSTIVGMNNSGASSRTVSVAVSQTVDGQTVTPRQFTIAAGVVRYVKLGPVSVYGSTVLLTPSHAEVKLAAFAL